MSMATPTIEKESFFEYNHVRKSTSVWLIKCTKSTADSERTVADMQILKPDSESPNDPPKTPQKSLAEISIIIEISVKFDFSPIIEYQIYSLIFPILQMIFG